MTDQPKKVLYHSTDGERTWQQIEIKPGTLLYHLQIRDGGFYDDGYGNVYRNEPPA